MGASWDSVADHVHFAAPLDLPAFIESVAPDAEVVDLGCGYGRISSQLVARGFTRVRGYDASRNMVERARALHPDLRVSVADAVAIPERDGSVDAIIVAALLTSIPNPETHRAIVQELRRVLRHDGTVHGVEFLRQDGMSYLNGGKVVSKADIAMWHFQPSELEQLFSAFANWRSRPVVTETLTGTPATVLQFVAHAA